MMMMSRDITYLNTLLYLKYMCQTSLKYGNSFTPKPYLLEKPTFLIVYIVIFRLYVLYTSIKEIFKQMSSSFNSSNETLQTI